MNRTTPLLFTLLSAFSCNMGIPGTPLPYTSDTLEIHLAVDNLVADWSVNTELPSLEVSRCYTNLETLEIRTLDEQGWINELRMCPLTETGCSTRAGCGEVCATGTVLWFDGSPRIFLSPGENEDTHVHTVRHETAHVLSYCTGLGIDHSHSNQAIWGSQGVVWTNSLP